MGVTAVAAVVGIGANVALGVAVETIAAVAITATVVGMVTKSPVLMKIGAGLGLASAGAGLIDAGSSATAETAAATSTADSGAAAAPTAATSAAPATAAAAGSAPETVTVTAPAVTGASNAGNVVANTASLAATGANTTQPSDNKVNAMIGDHSTDIKLQAPTIEAPKTPVMPEIQDPTSWFDTALTGIENHKALATSTAQLLGGALGGLGTTYAADKQYDINSQLLDLQKKKLANGSSQPTINPQYNGTANLYPTTTPVYSGTQTAGIINQQRQP